MKRIGKETNAFSKKKQYEKSWDLYSYPLVFVELNCAENRFRQYGFLQWEPSVSRFTNNII